MAFLSLTVHRSICIIIKNYEVVTAQADQTFVTFCVITLGL